MAPFVAEQVFFENWNRYYDPFTGRGLQPEPLLIPTRETTPSPNVTEQDMEFWFNHASTEERLAVAKALFPEDGVRVFDPKVPWIPGPTYSYNLNNPIYYYDPNGKHPIAIGIGISTAEIVAVAATAAAGTAVVWCLANPECRKNFPCFLKLMKDIAKCGVSACKDFTDPAVGEGVERCINEAKADYAYCKQGGARGGRFGLGTGGGFLGPASR